MEGITKTQHLRQRFLDQTERLDRVNSMMEIFRNGSDKEATEALARLRFGESVEEVLDYMNASSAQEASPDALQELDAKVQAEMGFSIFDEFGFLKAGQIGGWKCDGLGAAAAAATAAAGNDGADAGPPVATSFSD